MKKKNTTNLFSWSNVLQPLRHFLLPFNSKTSQKEFVSSLSHFPSLILSWAHSNQTPPLTALAVFVRIISAPHCLAQWPFLSPCPIHPSMHLPLLITASFLKQLLHLASTNFYGCTPFLVIGQQNIAKHYMYAYSQYKEYISGINFGQVRKYSKSSVENATKVMKKKEKRTEIR